MKSLLTIACLLAAAQAHAGDLKVVLWNIHNGPYQDRGTKSVKVQALNRGAIVWKSPKLEMPWSGTEDAKLEVAIPQQSFDVDGLKIQLVEWLGLGAGLAEIQVFKDGKDISKECKISASEVYENKLNFGETSLTDGVTTSAHFGKGYWLLNNKREGAVTIKLPST